MTEYQVVRVGLDGSLSPRGETTTSYEKAWALFRAQAAVPASRPTTIRLLERQVTRWRTIDEADRPVHPLLVPV